MNGLAPTRSGQALAAVILGAVLIGLAPIFVRLADVGPVACAFWRTALAWPVLALLARGEPQAGAVPAIPALPLAICGWFFAADLALWHTSIQSTSVANATLLANLAPVFVAAAAWLLWRESISRGFLLGLLLALGGAALLVGHSAGLSRASMAGDLLAVFAALFYAAYLLGVSRLRRHCSTLRVMSWTSAAAALALLPVAWLLGEPLWPQSAQGWAVLAGLALLSHVGGQGLIAYSMASLPATVSSVALLIQPLAAALFAWALLDEGFGLQQGIGGLVVLLGIVICRQASAPSLSLRPRRAR